VIIPARPYPNIKALFSSQGDFDSTQYEFHFLGREALLSCMIKLGLKSGDNIIIPAYICDSSIKPLHVYGFNLIFIDIDKNLNLPCSELKRIIDSKEIKALLLVHYFDYKQEIKEIMDLCREQRIKVIEDMSHGFLSQLLTNKKSIMGDAEIFSIRKSLPTADGGAMRINNTIQNSNKTNILAASDLNYLILRYFERIVVWMGINIFSQFINNFKNKFRRARNEIPSFNVKTYKISWQLQKYLGNKQYLSASQQKITKNFNQLSIALQNNGFRLFHKSLKDNAVPQACIVYDDNGGLVEYLRSEGIGAWQWPNDEIPDEVSDNSDQYPNTVFFDKNLVLIPVHQSLTEKKINYMIRVLSRWYL